MRKHLLLTTIAAVVLVGCGPKAPDISIHDAAADGNIEAVKQAIATGADVNAKDKDMYRGATPLHPAAALGHKEISELLIANGANVNVKNEAGYTPLHSAAAAGHKGISELLFHNGADVNGVDNWGRTPLHLAASSGQKTTIGLLISNGADLNLKDSNGKTTLDYFTRFKEAIEQNTTNGDVHHSIDETISLLRKHGGKTGEELKAEGK